MAVTAKVSSSPSANVATAIGRVTQGGRATSADHVEAVSAPVAAGVAGGWRSTYEDNGQGNLGKSPYQPVPRPADFSALISRSASAFSASESNNDPRLTPSLFLTDLLHGVGVYEFNMKVIAGTLKQQGQVLNRYS